MPTQTPTPVQPAAAAARDPWFDNAKMLLVLDDGSEDAVVREQRGRLLGTAAERRVRVETVTAEAPTEVARYAYLSLSGAYAAEYLRIGFVED